MTIYHILCRYCNKKMGFFDCNPELNPIQQIEDARCDEHEKEFGNYKETKNKFLMETGGTEKDFHQNMGKHQYKNTELANEISNFKIKRLKNVI